MTVRHLLSHVAMHDGPKGRMAQVGWLDGYLVIRYHGSPSTYILGPNVAEAERDKLLRVPYPDGLLASLRKKHGWQSHKVVTK